MALPLTTRRSTIAAVASALAAMAVAGAVAGRSCRVSQPGPEAAVHDLITAAQAGNREAVFELLGPATRQRLEDEAQRATNLVGATTRFTAKDLVSVGSSEGVLAPTDITVIEERDEHAIVEVVLPGGNRARMDLVMHEGRWRVELRKYQSVD